MNPASQVTGFDGNGVRRALLHDVEFRAERDVQRQCHLNLAAQVRGLELVDVAQVLVADEFDIPPAPRALPP